MSRCYCICCWPGFTGGERAYGCVLRGFIGGGLATLGISLIALVNMNETAGDFVALLLLDLRHLRGPGLWLHKFRRPEHRLLAHSSVASNDRQSGGAEPG